MNTIFFLRTVGEKCIEMQNDICLAFNDYEKTFDNVKHDVLMNDLKQIGIDGKDLLLLNNLYTGQVAAISINDQRRYWVPIEKRSMTRVCSITRPVLPR